MASSLTGGQAQSRIHLRSVTTDLLKQWDLLRARTFSFPGARVRSPLGKLITPPAWLQVQVGNHGIAYLRVDWTRRTVLWWDGTSFRERERPSTASKELLAVVEGVALQ